MKITNNIYSIYNRPDIKETKVQKPNVDQEKLTTEEKNFFKSKYPMHKAEIDNYHFYKNSGKMSGINIGLNFDKRG